MIKLSPLYGIILKLSMKEYLHTIFRLWKIFGPFHKWFYLQLFLIFLLQILVVSEAIVSSKMMNALVGKEGKIVVIFLFVMLVVELSKNAVNFFETRNDLKHLNVTLNQHIQEYSLKRILGLTIEQHTEDHSAMKLTIISQGEQQVMNVIDRIVTSIIPTLMLLVIAFATLIFVNPLIALIVGIMFPILLIWVYFFQRSHYPHIARNRDNWNSQFKTRAEVFSHLGLVKVLGQETKFIAHYLKQRAELFPHYFFTVFRTSNNSAQRSVFVDVLSIVVIAFAIYEYFSGAYTLGIIYLIMSMTSKIFSNVGTLSSSMREIPQSFVHIEKYLSVIDKEPSFNEGGEHGVSLAEDITFSDVSFQYPKGESPALSHCSFVIPAGKTTAFVGHSGSGKSTVARLLLRAYDYNDGSIKIGETSLHNIDAHYLRSRIGYVEQHVDLFDDTVRNNILMAVPEESRARADARLEEIGEKARISEFYHRLGEQKWDTMIGERGIKLSGGECQRIGIARAIIKDPQILLFDEATASLDTVNEKYVMDAINEVSKGKTTIIVAHRLSTVRNADKIIVMEKGKVVAGGTHDELMGMSPQYQDLVVHQIHEKN